MPINHALYLMVFGGLNFLKLWVAMETRRWVRTRHLSHKRLKYVEAFELGANRTEQILFAK